MSTTLTKTTWTTEPIMKIDYINIALAECHRFIRVAEKAAKAIEENGSRYYFGGPATAACRRASMDLTKALADLRRRGQ
jgi:hypothetical protein